MTVDRATIDDIARAAGVSSATVDRTINARSGVSAANRQRVLKSAYKLGYLPSEGAVILPSRASRLAFLIPVGGNSFIRDVSNGLEAFAKTHPLVESCKVIRLNGIGPDDFLAALDRLPTDISGIGIITTDHPKTREAISRVCAAGLQVVTMASDVPGTARAAYVGVDNLRSGRTAGQIIGMLSADRVGRVAIFLGSRAFNGHQLREDGFRACLGEHSPHLEILPSIEIGEDSQRLRVEMARLLRTQSNLIGIYCIGAGQRGVIEALEGVSRDMRPSVVMHDLTTSTRDWLVNDKVDAVIDQDSHLMADQAILRLLGAVANTNTQLPVHHIEPRIIMRENIPDENAI